MMLPRRSKPKTDRQVHARLHHLLAFDTLTRAMAPRSSVFPGPDYTIDGWTRATGGLRGVRSTLRCLGIRSVEGPSHPRPPTVGRRGLRRRLSSRRSGRWAGPATLCHQGPLCPKAEVSPRPPWGCSDLRRNLRGSPVSLGWTNPAASGMARVAARRWLSPNIRRRHRARGTSKGLRSAVTEPSARALLQRFGAFADQFAGCFSRHPQPVLAA